ncbi:MAG: hypothetical protein K6E93_00430 [Bacteroidales bacterium]|nr:hypothetical protein [Bacteroidales bacterium]
MEIIEALYFVLVRATEPGAAAAYLRNNTMKKMLKVLSLVVVSSLVIMTSSCGKEELVTAEVEYFNVVFPAKSRASSISSEWYTLPFDMSQGSVNAYIMWGTDVWSQLPSMLTTINPPMVVDYEYSGNKIKFNIFFATGDLITLNNSTTERVKVVKI